MLTTVEWIVGFVALGPQRWLICCRRYGVVALFRARCEPIKVTGTDWPALIGGVSVEPRMVLPSLNWVFVVTLDLRTLVLDRRVNVTCRLVSPDCYSPQIGKTTRSGAASALISTDAIFELVAPVLSFTVT